MACEQPKADAATQAAATQAEATQAEATKNRPASLELVVAVAENDVIGRDNELPWRLSADLRRFKALTLGKTVLMGRRTYESIGKALPGRTNLVLSRSNEFNPGDCTVVKSIGEARSLAGAAASLMVIGGAQIYELCLPFATRIHLTFAHMQVARGDAFFAGWRGEEWHETFRERNAADDRNDCPYSFVTLERNVTGSASM